MTRHDEHASRSTSPDEHLGGNHELGLRDSCFRQADADSHVCVSGTPHDPSTQHREHRDGRDNACYRRFAAQKVTWRLSFATVIIIIIVVRGPATGRTGRVRETRRDETCTFIAGVFYESQFEARAWFERLAARRVPAVTKAPGDAGSVIGSTRSAEPLQDFPKQRVRSFRGPSHNRVSLLCGIPFVE